MKKFLIFIFVFTAALETFSQTQNISWKRMDDSTLDVYKDHIITPAILFPLDKYTLNHPSHPMDSIKLIADFLKKHGNLTIEVGYNRACDPNAALMSTEITIYRAKAIAKALVDSFGIDPQRVFPKGYGETKPRVLEKNITTPGGKVIPAGTKLSEQWINKNFLKDKNKDDFEFVMGLNRRTEIQVLRTDYIPSK